MHVTDDARRHGARGHADDHEHLRDAVDEIVDAVRQAPERLAGILLVAEPGPEGLVAEDGVERDAGAVARPFQGHPLGRGVGVGQGQGDGPERAVQLLGHRVVGPGARGTAGQRGAGPRRTR
ncbi:hypothetical protein GCM10020358_29390 [Amorphoplanes nipponensis]|uniref:hypothetical protein n=1 Tax=Actinoplanes nipponensis TaxID=135950 RepID=UPI0031F0047C